MLLVGIKIIHVPVQLIRNTANRSPIKDLGDDQAYLGDDEDLSRGKRSFISGEMELCLGSD